MEGVRGIGPNSIHEDRPVLADRYHLSIRGNGNDGARVGIRVPMPRRAHSDLGNDLTDGLTPRLGVEGILAQDFGVGGAMYGECQCYSPWGLTFPQIKFNHCLKIPQLFFEIVVKDSSSCFEDFRGLEHKSLLLYRLS